MSLPTPDPSLFYFDTEEADKVISFIHKHLVYPQSGPGFEVGEPFKLRDWQIPHLRYIFGWKSKADGSRMVRETFWFIPKKNGKTAIGAIIALVLLLLCDEKNQNIISIAASAEQATLCFDMAKGMIEQSPTLGPLTQGRSKKIIIRKRSIEVPSTGSKYKVMSSSTQSIHGPSVSACLFDEFHAQKDRHLYGAVKGAGKARKSPIKAYISTAGYDRTSICFELYEYGCKIRDGSITNPRFYPVIYECPRDKEGNYVDWKDEPTWRAANPNFDLMNRVEWDNEFQQATDMPASENTFKQLALNIWTNQSSRWMPFEVWDKCRTKTPFAELAKQNHKKRVIGGLDCAPVNDTSSLQLLVPTDDDRYTVLTWVWIPTDNAVMRERKDRVPYTKWINDGFVKTTPGETTDYDSLYDQIKTILVDYDVAEIGFDNNKIGPIAQWLLRDGYNAVQISQGYESISPALGEVERLIQSQKLIVPQHPALDWMVSNAQVKTNSGGQRILDKSSYIGRIDAVAALVIAMKRAMVEAPEEAKSIYETEGVLMV